MDNTSTYLDIINLPKIEPDLSFDLGLGLASAIKRKIQTLTPIARPAINQTQTTKLGVIPSLIYILKQKEWKERDLKREQKIEKYLKDIDTIDSLSNFKKHLIELSIRKTDGCFELKTYINFVDTIEKRNKKEPINLWEAKAEKNLIFWSRKRDGRHIEPAQIYWTRNNEKKIISAREILDDNYGKNKERNDTIAKIRDKYLRGYKTGRGNYENLGNYYYKSPEAYKQFLEEVEREGLASKQARKKPTVEIKGFDISGFTTREIADYSNKYQEDEL